MLQFDSRRLDILGNAFFRFLEGGLSGRTRGVDRGLAFVQSAPPLGFLLGKYFGAGFLHCFVIDTLLFVRRYPAGFGLDPGAFGSLVALREHALHGLEKAPAHEQIKKENDNDRGDSRQEQLTELVNDFH